MSACSVIMVSQQAGPMLFASVKSVLRQQQLAELFIIDGGNTPDILARLQQMALTEPRLKIVSGIGRVDMPRGYNLGTRDAGADTLLFLSPDCLLPPDALVNVMTGLNHVAGAVLAGCWLVKLDGSEDEDCRKRLLTPEMVVSRAFGLFRKKPPEKPETSAPSETQQAEAISSAFMCIRKHDFDLLGGMDETLPYGMDLDLCIRVRKAGGKVICVPKVKVAHMQSESEALLSSQALWQKVQGTMRYFRKHFSDDCVPGFLSLLHLAIIIHFGFKVAMGGISQLFAPKSLMSHSVPAKRLMVLASGLAELPERKEWYGKTVLVTGATSQIGLYVVRRLICSGAAVLAMSRDKEIPFQHEYLRWIKADLTDQGLNLQGYLADMVVHCAPLWHLPGTVDMLADAEVKRVIAFGSTSVFGKALSRNAYEKDIVNKLIRAETALAEHCRKHNIHWTVLRPTLVYGAGLDLGVTSIAKFIDRFGFFPVYPPAFGRRQPVHADDLAMAVLQVAKIPTTYGKAYNVSGGEVVTYHQMLERLFHVCQKRTRIVRTTLLPFLLDMAGLVTRKKHINGEIARRMNDDLVFFHDEARRDFGFHPRPFLNGGIKDIEGF